MGVSLVLVRSDLSQLEIQIKHSPEVIGRHTDCKVRIPDPSVSRQHCEISIADGKIMLRDLGSSNGTYVNRKRITQIELAAGDMIAIGKFIFVLRVDGKPANIDSMEVLEDGAIPISSPPETKPAKAARAASPAKQPAKAMDPDDSSVTDFDFLDDDLDNQPKL
jgi:pSer/pThr/pTyr-binding forkhead associated (FHA) protein